MTYPIRPADSIEITILVDNYTDLILGEHSAPVFRPQLPQGQTLYAEHGLSLLIRIYSAGKKQTILMDAGASEWSLNQNAEKLGILLDEIEEIVISHGHYDHIGSLYTILQTSSCRIPVHLHPAAFAHRRKKCHDGTYTDLPILNRNQVTHAGGILSLSTEPSLLCNQHLLLTGEIERVTSFEKGSANLEAKEMDSFVKDSFRDDQSLIFLLKDLGLVVISGCAHAGIVNSVMYARKITGIDTVHAIIGGFHLSGPGNNMNIQPTITELQKITPQYIVPMHCSGWETQGVIAQKMPEQFILSTVGTRLVFGES